MCVGIGILSLGLGIAQGVMGFAAQSQAASAQNAYYTANAEAAQKAAINRYAFEQNKIIQERNAASQQNNETRIAALEGRSTARTASGEAGVSGLSVDALIHDYYGREGRRIDSIDSNYQMNRDYLRAEMESTRAQTEARINSVQKAAPPSFADAALRIGSNVLKTMTVYGPSTMNFATG